MLLRCFFLLEKLIIEIKFILVTPFSIVNVDSSWLI